MHIPPPILGLSDDNYVLSVAFLSHPSPVGKFSYNASICDVNWAQERAGQY